VATFVKGNNHTQSRKIIGKAQSMMI